MLVSLPKSQKAEGGGWEVQGLFRVHRHSVLRNHAKLEKSILIVRLLFSQLCSEISSLGALIRSLMASIVSQLM